MPEINQNHAVFTCTATGEVSGRTLTGKFTVKKRLSFRDQLVRDNLRRELLGPAKGEPLERAVNAADVFSELQVRIVDAPSWWTGADNGLGLEDDAVVGAVYRETMKIAIEANAALKAEADKAEADLKTDVAAQKTAA
jgi:hypothetical protein